MKIGVLPVSEMIATTGEWLANPVLDAEISAHPLGAALWDELRSIHEGVVTSNNQRRSAKMTLTALIGRIGTLGETHDSKARALRNLLLDLAAATDDPELAEELARLDALLFPQQLRIVQLPYWNKVGEVMQVEQRVTPAVLARLASLRVVDQTLADIYEAWIEAGKELGNCVGERARLEASLATEGTLASHAQRRKVRSRWIRGVRLLLDALPLIGISDAIRERLLAPLQKAIAHAEARRNHNSPSAEPDAEPDTEPDIEPDTEPEMEVHARPTARPTARPDIEPAARPPARPPARPAIEPAARPEMEVHARPDIEPAARPPARPAARPAIEPAARPPARPAARPAIEPAARPPARPAARPAIEPAARPAIEPAARPEMEVHARPTARPPARPAIMPEMEVHARPDIEPAARPPARPAIEPAARPDMEVHARPDIEPAARPPARPAIEPAARPDIEVHARPTIEPPARPEARTEFELHASSHLRRDSEPDIQAILQPAILPMIDSGILPATRAAPRPRPPTPASPQAAAVPPERA